MFGPLGMQELIFIFVIALIVFGPRKLPSLGKSLGKSIAEFKRASNELRSTLEREVNLEETRKEILEPIQSVARDAEKVVREHVNTAMDDTSAEVKAADAVDSAEVEAADAVDSAAALRTGDSDEDQPASADETVSTPVGSTASEPE